MKFKTITIGVLIFASIGCKKGANDPVFSIKPRKARLTGDWVAESATWSSNDTVWVFDGTNLEKVDSTQIKTVGYELTAQFTSLGDYTFSRSTIYPNNYADTTLLNVVCRSVETGLWNFTGGAGETQKKSQLLLLEVKKETTCSNQASNVNTISVSGQNRGVVYEIDRLTDNELTLKYRTTRIAANITAVTIGEIKWKKKK